MEKEIADKDNRDLKSKLKLYKDESPSFVVLIVCHREKEMNSVTRLSCKRLIPLDGYPSESRVKLIPVGGYVYDAVSDSYVVNCIDYLPVGFIPFCFKARMEGVGLWSIPIPFSESVIKRYINPLQRADLDKFQHAYKDDQFAHQFIQFVSS